MADLALRPAAEADAELLLSWRNDALTQRWSRGGTEVAPEEHCRWLRAVLAAPDRLLLIGDLTGESIGTVRFDLVDRRTWEVSITVAPAHRGHGLAAGLLAGAERELARRVPVHAVLACVHADNVASVALFSGAGYLDRPGPAEGPFRWLGKTLEGSATDGR